MIFHIEIHPFFIVEERFWPLYLCLAVFNFLFCFVLFCWKQLRFNWLFLNFILAFCILILWAKDVDWEGKLGHHTIEAESSLKWSMGWFIRREVLFFFSFFWAFFSFRLRVNIETGEEWPPLFITPLEAFSIPLLNTLILLRRGVSLTWGHHSLIMGNWRDGVQGFVVTILLGFYFTLLQVGEYLERTFRFNDSLWGRIFFLATGFHGAHVIIGTRLLTMCLLGFFFQRHISNHHMGVEARRWYWHFVDVVWLFLFVSIYWWGS